jgi:prepilin-type N-terminal cleavage/methylation domain-containing protein
MTKRKGFTLVELLVVLSVVAIVLPMAGGTVLFLLRAQSRSAEGLRDAMALTQLSHSFRSDVHAAQRARTPDAAALVLELSDARTIEYGAASNGVVTRIVRHCENVERREQFRVGVLDAKFAIVDGGRQAAITIRPKIGASTPVNGAATPRVGIRIAGVVARKLQSGASLSHSTPGRRNTLSQATSPATDRKLP